MKSGPYLLLFGLLCTHSVMAADLTLTADYWDYEVTGSVNRSGDQQDLDNDLGVSARENAAYSLAWNTGPGWWRPDFAASFTPIKADGERTNSGGSLGPIDLFPASAARGDADLQDTDLTLRYPLRFGWGSLWGGLTIKRIAGDISVRSSTDTSEDRRQIDQVLPLLHLAFSAPVTSWLSFSAQGAAVKYQNSHAYELRAGASVGVLGPVGLNLGWQYKQYRVADGDYLLDAKLSGAIAGVFVTLH